MKLSILLFTGLFLYNISVSQQVDKNYVLVEICTGTWCTYCPGAQMGASDLITNNYQVAVICHHDGDTYETVESDYRINTDYEVSGFPTAYFNGGDSFVGGSNDQSLYNIYLPKYNTAIAVQSDFTTSLSISKDVLNYKATVDIQEVGDYTETDLSVYLVVTESDIQEVWQTMTELHFVNRLTLPDENGTTYIGGNTSIEYNFTADESWVIDNFEVIAFIQDNVTKEILQVQKKQMSDAVSVKSITKNHIQEIYPNPVKDFINIEIQTELIGSTFKINDITGKTFASGELKNQKNQICVNDFQNGIYFISIFKDDFLIDTQKVLINK